jgi:hypothetical protein
MLDALGPCTGQWIDCFLVNPTIDAIIPSPNHSWRKVAPYPVDPRLIKSKRAMDSVEALEVSIVHVHHKVNWHCQEILQEFI